MKVEPGAADLLDIARATLLSHVVPALPEASRYEALMAANAIAVALRDLGHDTAAAERERVAALLPGLAPDASLAQANAQLAARIRAGDFDAGEARPQLREHLQWATQSRLAVSNPKALARKEPGR